MQDYLQQYQRDLALRGYSERTQTLQQSWEGFDIPRFKKKKRLPLVFSREEVAALLQHSGNLKYKALFSLIYSSGLRGSEAVHIQIDDIKRSSQKLLVRQGKGNKDRYTVLSLNCLKILEDYWRVWRPERWLFSGRDASRPLHPRSCQHAFVKAKQAAGITKPGSWKWQVVLTPIWQLILTQAGKNYSSFLFWILYDSPRRENVCA